MRTNFDLETCQILIRICKEPDQVQARRLLGEHYSAEAVQRMLDDATHDDALLSEAARQEAATDEIETAALLKRLTTRAA